MGMYAANAWPITDFQLLPKDTFFVTQVTFRNPQERSHNPLWKIKGNKAHSTYKEKSLPRDLKSGQGPLAHHASSITLMKYLKYVWSSIKDKIDEGRNKISELQNDFHRSGTIDCPKIKSRVETEIWNSYMHKNLKD